MDREIVIFTELSLSLILTVIVLSIAFNLIDVSSTASKTYQNEVNAQEQVDLYNKLAKYDNTVVSGSDVVSALYTLVSSDLYVEINGITYFGKVDTPLSTLQGNYPATAEYNAKIVYDGNGTPRMVVFTSV